MPFNALTKDMQFGTLSALISAGATTLTLVAGQGARFDAIASGSVVNLLIIDFNSSQNANYNRFEEVQATLLSGDTLTIVRAQNGTSAQQFPINSADNPALVKVFVADSFPNLRRFVQGQGAIIQATAPTLTSESPEVLVLTPVAPITLALPTTGVWAGRRFKIINLGSAANTITVNASGGTTVGVIPGGQNLELCAYQDAPTTNAHWGSPSSAIAPGGGSAIYVFPDIANRTIKVNGVDQNSYVSATGTAGTDNTAMTIPAPAQVTLKANSLNAAKRGIRITAAIGASGAGLGATLYLGTAGSTGDLALSAAITAQTGLPIKLTADVYFIDATHVNSISFNFAAGAGSTTLNANGTTNINNAADMKITIGQQMQANTHLIVYSIFVEVLG